MQRERFLLCLCVIALTWAIVSCSSFNQQTEDNSAASSIRGCQLASSSTISPQLASLAEAYTLFCYGELFGLRGEMDKALAELEKAGTRLPQSGYINFEQARILIEQDRIIDAIEMLDSTISKSPDMAEAYVLRGDAHRMLLDIPKAVRDYRRGAELGFDEATLRFTIAELLNIAREYDEAIVELKRLKEIEPDSLRADFSLGRLYLNIKEPAKAVPYLEAVVAAHPGDLHSTMQLFEAYQQSSEFEDAIVLARKLVARMPQDAQFRYLLATFMEQAGKLDEAIEQLETLVKMDPDFAAGLNCLGYIYIDKGLNLKRGISLVRAALAIEPHNSAFLDSLGWGLFRLGDLGAAIKQLEKAVAGLKDLNSEPIICGHLAIAYKMAGRTKDAEEYTAILKSASKDDSAIQELLNELSSISVSQKDEEATVSLKDAVLR
ncbi:MAG: tetratricopeptide repeat protein [Candidatus Coatesbacteria bacterium]|nr:tetratricopeptide repeat protein [Candidatus Coatesbacteria bacterium]